ncbi:MAG: GlsB/YeaQ/YmgE family stress response membrane protein [Roseiflexaceae bacterium]
MGIISWIIFGALAGWVASLIMGGGDRRGCLGNVILGIVGAFLGGLIVELVTGRGISYDWNWRSFGVAVLGAVLLLVIVGPGRARRK